VSILAEKQGCVQEAPPFRNVELSRAVEALRLACSVRPHSAAQGGLTDARSAVHVRGWRLRSRLCVRVLVRCPLSEGRQLRMDSGTGSISAASSIFATPVPGLEFVKIAELGGVSDLSDVPEGNFAASELKSLLAPVEEDERLPDLGSLLEEKAGLVAVALTGGTRPGDLDILATEQLAGEVHPVLVFGLEREREREREEGSCVFLYLGELACALQLAVAVGPAERIKGLRAESQDRDRVLGQHLVVELVTEMGVVGRGRRIDAHVESQEPGPVLRLQPEAAGWSFARFKMSIVRARLTGGPGGTCSTRYLASAASSAAILPSSAIPPPVNWPPSAPGMSMLRSPMFSAGI
jgi:hypothetical protein